jgi:hypothetical protein
MLGWATTQHGETPGRFAIPRERVLKLLRPPGMYGNVQVDVRNSVRSLNRQVTGCQYRLSAIFVNHQAHGIAFCHQ